MKPLQISLLLIIAILILAACAPPIPTSSPEATLAVINDENTSTQPEATPYPPPPVIETSDDIPYPPPTVEILPIDVYPGPESTKVMIGASAFQLNKPIFEGATEITGVGLAGVPIMIEDLTFMGEILGRGVIDEDGTFSISVEALEKAHRIGIALDNLEGTQWSQEDFYDEGFNGEDPMQVPLVGYFYDTAIIEE